MKINKIVIYIFIFSLLIRLIFLNQSLWLDEAITARVVQQYSYSEIVAKFSPQDFHPPLYYLFMKSWSGMFGYSEIAIRFPSIIFSLITGYLIYLISGIWGSIFFLFNPLIIYYSQEARMYMLATMFLAGGLYYFLKNQKIKIKSSISETKNILLMNLFFVLALFSFYGSIFFISSFLVYFFYKRQYKNLLISLIAIFSYFLLISPLLYQQLINAKVLTATVVNWTSVLGKANLKNILLIPLKFSIGRIDFYPKIIYWSVAGFWTLFVFYQMLKKGLKEKIYLFLFVFPLVLAFIASFITPMLQYFRFIYLIPIMAILLGKSKVIKINYILLTGFIIFSFVYLLFPQFHREDWKNLVKSLDDYKPVYVVLSSSDPLKYYRPSLLLKDLSELYNIKSEKEIIIIPYTADIHGINYQEVVQEKGYQLSDKKYFRGVQIEEYLKN